MSEVETKFLLISEAVAHLEAGMFRGPITRSEPVRKLKEKQPRLSVGLGRQREKAAADILTAILKVDLTVHALAQSPVNGGSRSLVVPVDVLQLIPKVRGGLPDHPGRLPVSLLRTHSSAPTCSLRFQNLHCTSSGPNLTPGTKRKSAAVAGLLRERARNVRRSGNSRPGGRRKQPTS